MPILNNCRIATQQIAGQTLRSSGQALHFSGQARFLYAILIETFLLNLQEDQPLEE